MRLFSYIVAHDYGLAPNPYWGRLTLTVCKPAIRRTAEIGDWVIGTGSKNVYDKNGNRKNHSGRLVFAMKIEKVLTMEEYDNHCKATKSEMKFKRPHNNLFNDDWRHKVGDSIYDYSNKINNIPGLRNVIHQEEDKPTDLGGINALISKEFYYLGNSTIEIPIKEVSKILKKEQGHLVLDDTIESDNKLIIEFLNWLKETFKESGILGEPQKYWDLENLITKKKKCHKLKKVLELDK
jgi:hypothetical protein